MAEDPQLAEAVETLRRGEMARAQTLAEAGVRSSPSPHWHHLLGLILCRQGKQADGVEHLRAAARAEPANAAFQVMLARALVDAGRAEEVLAMPEPPPITTPPAMALWQARAEAADSAGRPDVAAEAWGRIAGASPGEWRALANFGNALAAQNRWPEAADALAEAARLNPAEEGLRANAVAALLRCGALHQALLRFDRAVEAFRTAFALDPGNRPAIHHLGIALERTNRLDALAELLDEATAAGIPDENLAYLFAVRARREGRLEQARELLLRADPADDLVAWNALMAKICDALGDCDAAFDAAEAMNRAAIEREVPADRRDEWERHAADYRKEQRALARTITPQWAAKLPVLTAPPDKRVAFLLGFPRSGTTLLDTFLLGHPEVEVLEEKQLVGEAARVTGPLKKLPSVPIAVLERARSTYFARLAEQLGRNFDGLAIDKFPLDMGSAPLIHALFPDAPIIFAQRHPCDVVLSGFLQPFGTVNFSSIRDAADYYDAMMSIWSASLESLPLNVHTIVYEELVSDPERVLRPLVGFLGLEWDDRVLDHRATASARGTIVTPSYDQVTEPVSTRSSGRWKRYRKQMEPVLPILLPWAERFGYRD